jgi:hypothetical protein
MLIQSSQQAYQVFSAINMAFIFSLLLATYGLA